MKETQLRRQHATALVAASVMLVMFADAPTSQSIEWTEKKGSWTAEEFDKMFNDLSNWGRWGKEDELGAVNMVTTEKTKQALKLATRGITVSLAHAPMTEGGQPDLAKPTLVRTMSGSRAPSDTYLFDYHGYASSHMDALCHWTYKGMFYNNWKAPITPDGCARLGIQNLKNGVVTRAVLIDIPRLKGLPYLEPGTPVYVEDLEAWEKKAGVRVGAGDVLLLYTGRWARRAKLGAWPLPNGPHAGFHVSTAAWMKQRDVSIVGGDVDTDMRPTPVQGLNDPMHTFLIVGLGVNILDAFDLEAVAETAARLKKWEFVITLAPLPVTGGTGGPINAIAMF